MVSSIRAIKLPGRDPSAGASVEPPLLIEGASCLLPGTGASLLKVASDTYAVWNSGCRSKKVLMTLLLPAP
ncbi:hypothetical protein D3C81_1221820 [compost metagenome]